MKKPHSYWLAAILLTLPLSLQGAGFDCSKAASAVEKIVCADAELSALDSRLTVAYKAALADKSKAAAVKAAQKEWLASVRDVCEDAACLRQAYQARLAELGGAAASVAKPAAIDGKYERYFQGKPDTHSASITLREMKGGQVQIEGEAVWVGNAKTGNVNTGELQGIFARQGDAIQYTDGEAEGCRLTITIAKNSLNVSGDNGRCGGMNVNFDGQYRKAGKAK